jgi:hypothetical protein
MLGKKLKKYGYCTKKIFMSDKIEILDNNGKIVEYYDCVFYIGGV